MKNIYIYLFQIVMDSWRGIHNILYMTSIQKPTSIQPDLYFRSVSKVVLSVLNLAKTSVGWLEAHYAALKSRQ